MKFALDEATEQRIRRELERGHYREPAEVIARALELLEAEEEWLTSRRLALQARLEQSMGQIDRGEGIPGDRVLEVLAERREAPPKPVDDRILRARPR
jgi:Arc/MetJ-type ribon-helix-helix transcriptional regulator